jgi:DNA modification methylase
MNVVLWPIEKPIPYVRNARKISDAAIEKVALSIREFGWRQPIVVDAEGVIIAGHTRLLAAKKLKLTQVPIHIATDLTPEQVKAYRLMDNRSHEEAEWDLDLLGKELFDLQSLEMDLGLTGFDEDELAELLADKTDGLTDPDEVPDTPEEPVTTPGDLWVLGKHRLICGDCTQANVVERVLSGAAPILLVTDPPYGISLDLEWRDRVGLHAYGPAEPSYMKKRTEGHTHTTISGDTRADWSEAFDLVPSLQVAYVWHASVFTREVLNGLERIGFLKPQMIIWHNQSLVFGRTHYWYQHDPCWYVRKKNAPWYGKPGENRTVWSCSSPKSIMGSSEEKKYDHPTQKPVELMRKSIRNHTIAGEVVYEPFCGSGTTLIAAENLGRTCCAIELEPKYIDVIITRWQNFTGKQATLEGDGRTFEEVRNARTAVTV